MPGAEKTPSVQEPKHASRRIISVDALRGFDMFWIMGGDQLIRSLQKIHPSRITDVLFEQMEHVPYEGFHFYDLIFPLFVFIAGIAIPFSVPRMIETNGLGSALRRITARSVILFLMGVFYMGGIANGFSNVYLVGVLHRIAVAYFFAAILFCFCRPPALVLITVSLLVGYWALMTFVPVPGFGHASYAHAQNLAYYLDQRYLPGQKFEGTLLSTTSAVANCLLGVFAGLLLRANSIRESEKVPYLLAAGVIMLLGGWVWGQHFPIIKVLWTSSYVLVACGWGAILMAVFHQVIEIWNYRKWAQPFVWIGMNAITIYMVSAIFSFRKIADRFAGGDISKMLGIYSDFVKAILVLAMVFALVRYLYNKRVFLRL